jgi:hypothetical protein
MQHILTGAIIGAGIGLVGDSMKEKIIMTMIVTILVGVAHTIF